MATTNPTTTTASRPSSPSTSPPPDTSIPITSPDNASAPDASSPKPSNSAYLWLLTTYLLPSPLHSLTLFLAISFSLACGAPLPAIGVLFGQMINAFPPDSVSIRERLTQLLAIATGYFAMTWIWTVCWGIVGQKVGKEARRGVLQRVLEGGVGEFDSDGTDISSHLTTDILNIQLGTSEKLGLILQGYAYFLASFITGFILNARLTGILLAGIIPALGLVIVFGSANVAKTSRLASESTAAASKVAEEALTNISTVQAYGAEGYMLKQHESRLKASVRAGVKKAVWGGLMHGGAFLIAYAAYALAFWEGANLVDSGRLATDEGAGTVFTIIFLILDSSLVVGRVTPFINFIAVAGAAAGRVRDIGMFVVWFE